jgi:hypothetical protein
VIAENSAKVKERFEPKEDKLDDEPVAIVAYGPSLQDTWKEIHRYDTIITCSGAYKFLLKRGIVPGYHVESDPRIHKVDMLGTPSIDTTFIIASICHPRYFDKLAGFEVLLWHIFFDEPEIYSLIPKGDWILTGGNTVGPRAIKIARLMGYTNLHMYGFDGSGKHAGEHGNPPPDRKYKRIGRFTTTDNLLDHVELLFQDLSRIPDATFTFHGDGLIQTIAKTWKYKFQPGYPLAVVKDD